MGDLGLRPHRPFHRAHVPVDLSESPVFSGPAVERLASAPIKECIVTNTIPLDMSKMPSNIKQISVAPLLAQAISRIHDDESISSLFGFEKEMQV